MAFDPNSSSFTVKAQGGLFRVLQTTCHIAAHFDPATGAHPPQLLPFAAIWDTGATATAITQNVVDQCGLVATGMVQVQTAAGLSEVETYLIDVGLPNSVGFRAVTVSKAILGPGSDVLIGMDIISSGDFSITNQNGNTVFSFRVPSCHTVDFVLEHNNGLIKYKMAQAGKGGFRQHKKKK